ncbi:MAG: hypothetical protein A2X08_17415 [Bacteroidetes bacterium GWA2_32_17]|nr:MAG: hypothetical protein A2X08_17415 [Bacteroidetes bacterium GWA2_32_17]
MGYDWDNYNNTKTFKKGSMYFIAKGGYTLDRNFSLDENWYHFSIETGDNSRKGGKNAEKFNF